MEGHCVQVQRAQDEPGPRVGPEGRGLLGQAFAAFDHVADPGRVGGRPAAYSPMR
jgi:hypothetical protein